MAKTSILTILIQLAKTGNADKETIKGLAQMKAGVTQAMGVFAALAGAAYTVNKALDATVGTFVNYAAQVREMNRLTGAGTEETSRLIQMADDLTISYESLQKSLWFASKNGVEVNVDSLARLADEYVALNDPMAKADFLAKNFGKSGADMAKMLEQGGSAVRDWADSIEGSLVLTEKAVQEAREYELALDELNDQWLATKVAIGQGVLPVMNEFLFNLNHQKEVQEEANRLRAEGTNILTNDIGAMALANVKIAEYTQGLDSAGTSYRAWAEQIAQGTEDIAAQTEAIDAMNMSNEDMLSLMLNLQSESDRYNEDLAGLTEKMTALKDEQALYLEGGAKYEELQGQIDATGQAIDDLANKHEEAGKRIAFSMLQQQLASDGLTEDELANLQIIGLQWGILSEDVITASQQAVTQIKRMTDQTAKAKHEAKELMTRWQKMLEITGSAVDFFVNIHTSGSFGPALRLFSLNNEKPDIRLDPGDQYIGAKGGQLAGGWTMVGEEGFEVISPNGYVFPHDVANQLVQSGMNFSKELAGGGYWAGEFTEPTGAPKSKSVGVASGGQYKNFSTRVRQDRGELSGGGGSSAAAAEAAVTEAVAPLAGATADAIGSAQVTQQITVTELQATRDAIREGNDLMRELIDMQQRTNATYKNSVVAAVQQVMG